MQFFSPGKSRNRYLGIFYTRPGPDVYSDVNGGGDEKALWIANRDDPITDTSGSLTIDPDGRLMISHSEGKVIMLSATPTTATNLTAILLDNGNFVLRELNTNGFVNRTLWQSFDYPTDTLLPGMKLGINLRTGYTWFLTSWVNDQSPASGSFTFDIDPNGTNQLIILWMGKVYWKSGPWLTGYRALKYVSNEDEKYFTYTVDFVFERYTVSPSGLIQNGFDRNVVFGSCSNKIPNAECVKQVLPQCRAAKNIDCKAKCENDCSCIAYNKKRLSKKFRHDIQIFSLETIIMATNNFSSANKLGEGGYAPVYKGMLLEGQEIAIKRLSKSSGQGLVEFQNEIMLISKLQHTNLVRLLGCCIEGEEKILVYEYMMNKSLDFFLFDPSRKDSLKWNTRLNIIEGVAQGLLYLLKYLRLRVIHRDLKASNILLDDNMNSKISDFGLARIFGRREFEANTERIVGTYCFLFGGYMSPEYAMNDIVSMKTDVFSFGVLVLEILSGKRNNSCYHLERPLNLIGYAWELWKAGRVLEELTDPVLSNESTPTNEIMRCIHVGLLCVQANPNDRPSMNDSLQLPVPKQPAFFIEKAMVETETREELRNCSTNGLTISDIW
ncbi:hypothetical protein K7X08_024063 [Anisodus acutangulus]|uniref:non-specific serine/threonine protein kinase n=1 Tax=Anisodus acutangulus TaxID=402998 RepID=A0A9Q1REM4_9SOLA|nr:hypothetical protein K7X08_024063 [Anisodus acutangulus]